MENFDYLLVYEEGKGSRLTLRSVRKGSGLSAALIRVTGKPAKEGYKDLVDVLSRRGGLKLIEKSASKEEYGVRADIAPIAGAFILLLRRSVNPSKWGKLLHKMFGGPYDLLGESMVNFFIMALNLSSTLRKSWGKNSSEETILPHVADAFSTAMKGFFNSIERRWKEGS